MKESDKKNMCLEDKLGYVGLALGVSAGFVAPIVGLMYTGPILDRLIVENGTLKDFVGAIIVSCLGISALGSAQAAGGYGLGNLGYRIGEYINKMRKRD